MLKVKVRKFIVWINLYFLVLITAIILSFVAYKMIELRAKASINWNIQEDLLLRWDLQNWWTSLESKLLNYVKNDWKLFYIQDNKDLEKFKEKEYCNKKNLIILNWKNFQEVEINDNTSIYITPTDQIYTHHCYYQFKLFDTFLIKVK